MKSGTDALIVAIGSSVCDALDAAKILQADGSVRIPEVLQPYMGGQEYLKA